MSCGVGYRRGSDPCCSGCGVRPAAVALIRPLAWKPPYAAGMALKSKKQKKKKKKKKITSKQALNLDRNSGGPLKILA